MIFSKLGLATTFAALTAALPHTIKARNTTSTGGGSGGVEIVNNLEHDVYAWSVSNRAGDMKTLSAGGGSYSEPWHTNSNGGGVSIKLSTQPDQTDVLQFEYTQGGDTIFWDMSCIDMGTDSKFTDYGFTVEPSETGANCPPVNCHAGDKTCADAYLQPKDDHATHGCPINTSFKMNIGN